MGRCCLKLYSVSLFFFFVLLGHSLTFAWEINFNSDLDQNSDQFVIDFENKKVSFPEYLRTGVNSLGDETILVNGVLLSPSSYSPFLSNGQQQLSLSLSALASGFALPPAQYSAPEAPVQAATPFVLQQQNQVIELLRQQIQDFQHQLAARRTPDTSAQEASVASNTPVDRSPSLSEDSGVSSSEVSLTSEVSGTKENEPTESEVEAAAIQDELTELKAENAELKEAVNHASAELKEKNAELEEKGLEITSQSLESKRRVQELEDSQQALTKALDKEKKKRADENTRSKEQMKRTKKKVDEVKESYREAQDENARLKEELNTFKEEKEAEALEWRNMEASFRQEREKLEEEQTEFRAWEQREKSKLGTDRSKSKEKDSELKKKERELTRKEREWEAQRRQQEKKWNERKEALDRKEQKLNEKQQSLSTAAEGLQERPLSEPRVTPATADASTQTTLEPAPVKKRGGKRVAVKPRAAKSINIRIENIQSELPEEVKTDPVTLEGMVQSSARSATPVGGFSDGISDPESKDHRSKKKDPQKEPSEKAEEGTKKSDQKQDEQPKQQPVEEGGDVSPSWLSGPWAQTMLTTTKYLSPVFLYLSAARLWSWVNAEQEKRKNRKKPLLEGDRCSILTGSPLINVCGQLLRDKSLDPSMVLMFLENVYREYPDKLLFPELGWHFEGEGLPVDLSSQAESNAASTELLEHQALTSEEVLDFYKQPVFQQALIIRELLKLWAQLPEARQKEYLQPFLALPNMGESFYLMLGLVVFQSGVAGDQSSGADNPLVNRLNSVSMYFLEKVLRDGKGLPFKIDSGSDFYIVDLGRKVPTLLDARNSNFVLDSSSYNRCRLIESMMLRNVCYQYMQAGESQKVEVLGYLKGENLRSLPIFEFDPSGSCWIAQYPLVQREEVFRSVDRLLNFQLSRFPGVTVQQTAKFLLKTLLLLGIGEMPLGGRMTVFQEQIMDHVITDVRQDIREVPMSQLLNIRQRLRWRDNILLVKPIWISEGDKVMMQMMPVLTRETLKDYDEGASFKWQKLAIARSGKMNQWFPKERRWGWTSEQSHFNAQSRNHFCCGCAFQFEPDDSNEVIEYWGLDQNCQLHFLKGAESNLMQLSR